MKVQTFAERLNIAIGIRCMTQQELSDVTKIPKSAISQYLSAKFEAKQDRIEALARALNVSEAWLTGFDVPMERSSNVTLERIIEELKRQGKKQYELTDYLNLNHNSFGNWKSGLNKSYLKYLYQIAEFLDLSVEYLKGETDEKEYVSLRHTSERNIVSETDQKFLELLATMNESDKQWLLSILTSIIERMNK